MALLLAPTFCNLSALINAVGWGRVGAEVGGVCRFVMQKSVCLSVCVVCVFVPSLSVRTHLGLFCPHVLLFFFFSPCHSLLLLTQSTRLWINSHLYDRRRMVVIQEHNPNTFHAGLLRRTNQKTRRAAARSSLSAIRQIKRRVLILPMCLQQVLPIWPPLFDALPWGGERGIAAAPQR